jgi:hypothetical protein
VPAFIDIGQRFDVGEGEELKAFHTAGFLGSEFGPFLIANPAEAVESVRPPEGMSPARFENREKFYKSLVAQTPVGNSAAIINGIAAALDGQRPPAAEFAGGQGL